MSSIAPGAHQLNVEVHLEAFSTIMDEQDQPATTCSECESEILLGRDAIRLEEGVIGNRGFVELETMLFCSDSCLRKHICDQDLISIDRRIP